MRDDAGAVAGNNKERCRGGALFGCRGERGVGCVAEVVLAEDIVGSTGEGKFNTNTFS